LIYPCGDGALCGEVAAQVPLGLVVGIDPSDDQVRVARAALRDLDNVMILCSDLTEIPWKEDFFTHAIVPAELASLPEVNRVLAEDGRVHSR
jgi:ubiquinone/menaquinone biosynthesis C-methylase UbiE